MELQDFVSKPIKVKAIQLDINNDDYKSLPGFKSFREGFNHAVFDRYQNGTGTLIVQPDEWIVYFPTGQIKSYTQEQFDFMFIKDEQYCECQYPNCNDVHNSICVNCGKEVKV